MSNIVVRSRLSITDLNDQISGATAPSNPDENSLWLDTSTSPPVLKYWNGNDWIPQRLDISGLDPDLSVTIETIESTMGNMANDNMLDINERGIVVDNLYEIIGYVISNETNAPATLPTVATLEASKKGNLYQTRATAKSAGISTSASSYVAVETTYNALSTYLMNMTPIKPWDVTTANKDKFVTVVKETYRQVWLNYYLAIQKLVEDTALQVKQQIDDHDDRILTVSAGIETLKDSLKFYASKKEVEDTLTSYPTKTEMDAAIEVKADEINLGVKEVKESVDNMEIGGRNLLDKSASPQFSSYQSATITRDLNQTVTEWGATDAVKHTVTGGTGTDATIVGTLRSNIKTTVEKGKKYTHSIYIKNIGTTTLGISNNLGIVVDVPAGQVARVEIKGTGSTTQSQVCQFVLYRKKKEDTLEFYAWHAKIETGNKATDWIEAPEDVDKAIDNALSTSKTYTDTQIRLNTEEINLGITQKVVEEVGKVEIGGRNYYKTDTSITSKAGGIQVIKDYPDCTNGFYFVGREGGLSSFRINNVINSNGYWTVSFWLRGSQKTEVGFLLDICDLGQKRIVTTSDNTWKKVTLTVNVTNHVNSPQTYHFVDFDNVQWAYFFIKDFKVEKGSVATDWSLAPEDEQKNIDNAVGKINSNSRNLLGNTKDFSVNGGVGTVDKNNSYLGNDSLKGTFTTGSFIDPYVRQTTVVPTGNEYTLTFWAKADKTLSFTCFFYSPNTTTSSINSNGYKDDYSDGRSTFTATTEWKQYWVTWKQSTTTEKKTVIIGRIANAGSVWINSPMLVEGNKTQSWLPAPEDTKIYKAWSNKEDGSNMVKVYPKENLLANPYTTKGISWDTVTPNNEPPTNGIANHTAYKYLLRFEISSLMNKVKENDILTISFDVKSDDGAWLAVYDSNSNFGLSLGRKEFVNFGTNLTRLSYNTKLIGSDKNTPYWILEFYNNNSGVKFSISNLKIEFEGQTVYTPSPEIDPVKAEMAYIGYSTKNSDNPRDYTWNVNPKASGTFKRWANDPSGQTDFTKVKPYENLIINSKSLEDTVFSTSGWQINDSSYYSGFKQLEITTTESGWKETVIDLNLPYGEIKDKVRVSLEYMNEVEGALQVALGAYKGKNGRIKETSNIPVDTNFTLKKLPNGLTFGYYVFDTTPLQNVEGADRYVIEFKRINGKLGKAVVVKPKIINSNDLDLIYTPSPMEDPVNSRMRYVGIGLKDSDNPKDYYWQLNTESVMSYAWANDPTGRTDFTTRYPNENIASMGTLMVHSVDSANVVTITPTEIDMVSTGKVYVGFRTFGEGAYQPSTYYTMSFKLLLNSGTINHIGGHTTYMDALHSVKIDGKDIVTNGSGSTWSNGIPYNFVVGKEYDIEVRFTTKETGMHGTVSDGVFIQPNRGMPSTGWAAYTATISKFKVEEGQIRTPFITSANDDPANSIMLYEGTSLKGGNNPADYTWSPMRASATEVKEVQLQLTPDSIYAKVSQAPDYIVWKDLVDSKPSIDDLNNVYDQLDGLSSADETILASMAELEIANNGVLTSITQAVEGMDGTLSTITDYMFFGTNGLTIGKSDSPMKVNISNTELAFYDNSTKVAWVDSQRLNIGEAVVEKKIKVGNHIIEKFNDKEEITIFKYDGV